MQPVAPNFRLELHAVLSSGYEKEKEHVEKQKAGSTLATPTNAFSFHG